MSTSRFIISIGIVLVSFLSQAQKTEPKIDTITKNSPKHIRLGFDISRPIIQLAQNQDLGFEITADYRVKKNWYATLELGTASEPGQEDYITFHTKGQYAKLGFNYNTFENWKGMNNEVYVGLRYGISSFQQELISFTPNQPDYFGSELQQANTIYKGLNASWLGVHAGLKVELIKNLFLSSSIQIRKLLSQKEPEGFANLYIPGFDKVLLNNKSFGFNYTISYLIPLNFKKNEQKN